MLVEYFVTGVGQPVIRTPWLGKPTYVWVRDGKCHRKRAFSSRVSAFLACENPTALTRPNPAQPCVINHHGDRPVACHITISVRVRASLPISPPPHIHCRPHPAYQPTLRFLRAGTQEAATDPRPPPLTDPSVAGRLQSTAAGCCQEPGDLGHGCKTSV